jgi:hypothetical protein
LSIDPDVALWLDYRSFSNQHSLKVIDDFVVVSDELHDEYDSFKQNELAEFDAGSSLLPPIELLQLCLSRLNISAPFHSLYGKDYVALTGSQFDSVSGLVQELRIEFMSKGNVIFQECDGYPANISKIEGDNKVN